MYKQCFVMFLNNMGVVKALKWSLSGDGDFIFIKMLALNVKRRCPILIGIKNIMTFSYLVSGLNSKILSVGLIFTVCLKKNPSLSLII